jgi:hypothetical protein
VRRHEESDGGGGGEALLDEVVGGVGGLEEEVGESAHAVIALDLGAEGAQGPEGFKMGLDVWAGEEMGVGQGVGRGFGAGLRRGRIRQVQEQGPIGGADGRG